MNLPQRANEFTRPATATSEQLKAVIARLLPTASERPTGRKDDTLFDPILARALGAEQRAEDLQSQVDRLREMSTADEVTGLLNIRGFCDALDRELDRAKRNGGTGVVLLIGIDCLRATIEHQDQAASEQILNSVAELLQGFLRMSDYIARIGDGEFAVLLTHTSWPRGERRAKSLERRLLDENISNCGRTITIGAHVGVEFYRSGDEADALLQRVEMRLQLHRDGESDLAIRTV